MTGIIKEPKDLPGPTADDVVVELARRRLSQPFQKKCGLLRALLNGENVVPHDLALFSDSDLAALARIFARAGLAPPTVLTQIFDGYGYRTAA
ncbi:MAG: hypothetical protein QG621_424 [Patescibacteria group bacterium]|jgi:hypothetical protein|nr:hypothetical protein [Patescibacteria group bacterium]